MILNLKYILFFVQIYQIHALISHGYNHNVTLQHKIRYCKIAQNLNLGETSLKQEVFRTFKISSDNSTHSELECGENYVQRHISIEEFSINNKSELHDRVRNTSYSNTEYCLVHRAVQNISRTFPSVEVRVCEDVKSVDINRCVLEGNNTRNCCKDEENTFNPQILLQRSSKQQIFKFKWVSYALKCPEGSSMKRTIHDNFSLLYEDITKVAQTVSKTNSSLNYCVDKDVTNETYYLYFCATKPAQGEVSSKCQGGLCIRKCCPKGYLYDFFQNKCEHVNLNFSWKPTFFSQEFQPVINQPTNASFVYGFPLCDNLLHLRPSEDQEQKFYIFENGDLYVTEYDAAYGSDLFCVDYFKYNEIREESLLCFPERNSLDDADCTIVNTSMKPALMLISCVFLTITIIVYVMIPELRSKINGKCVISSTTALLLTYVSLITIEWGSGSIAITMCRCLGLFVQFFSLSSFFWLNVMCFDVWRTLRSQHHVAEIASYRVNKRFLKYSAYAWGVPFCISLVTAIMQFHGEANDSNGGLITPGFGAMGCFFPTNDPRPSWIYFYGFISVIMFINLGFFLHLLIILQRQKTISETTLQLKNKRQMVWLKIYLKLFCVMGVTWIFEIMSWIGGSCKLWIFTDLLNSLRGVFIFLIFICKRNILQQVRKKIISKRIRRIGNQTHSSFSRSRVSSKTQTTQFYVDLHENE